MINKYISVSFMVILFLCCSISELFGVTKIKADDPNFQYTGRIDFSTPDQPVLFWPGTYIKANFEGILIFVMLDDKNGQSSYDVFIDEDYDHPHVIQCSAGSKNYLVTATLSDTVHSLLIFRRTEASTGPTKFLGVELFDGKTLLEPPARPKRKILFYGNSITCGMGNEAPDGSADDNLAQENNFLAYGAVASRLLNADYMCIAKSGIGIIKSWFDLVMPDYYYRLNPDSSNSMWDFGQFEADVVVINLFQNDSWLLSNIDSTTITNAYINFVEEIRSHHTDAFIICSLGSMDATRAGSPWPGFIEGAVQYMREVNSDQNIETYFFPFDPSWTKHPRVRHHLVMGENLAAFIDQNLHWLTDVDRNSNKLSPLDFGLKQNYPNPFNPSTTIEYSVETPCIVKIVIYDALGREIKTVVNEFKNSGSYKEIFNAENLSSGIYFYQLNNGNNIQTKSMSLLK